MNKLSEIDYIKMAILNPLNIYNYIMGLGFPDERYVYTNIMYVTFKKSLDLALPYDLYEPVLDMVLERHNITLDALLKVNKMSDKLGAFMSIIEEMRMDLLPMYAMMGESIKDGSEAEEEILNYRRLVYNLYLDPGGVYPELRTHLVLFTDREIEKLSIWVCESVQTILYNMIYHADEEQRGRVFMYKDGILGKQSRHDFVSSHRRLEPFCDIDDDIVLDASHVYEKKEKEATQGLRREVNNLDIQHGCDLKHPGDIVDTPSKFEVKINKLKKRLTKYLFRLNKMDFKKKMVKGTIYGTEVQNIEITKKFRKASPWFGPDEVEIDDVRFRVRFISYLFAWTIRHIKDVAEICFAINKDNDELEYLSKIDYAKRTVDKAIALADKIVNGEDMGDDLIYFEELIMYMESSPKTKKKVFKNTKNLRQQSQTLALDCRPFPAVPMYSQDILMDTMCKLAYMVSTHDIKMKIDIPFHQGYKFRKTRETKVIIKELGASILKRRKKCGVPLMFKYFVSSDPIIYSKWEDVNRDRELCVGVMALKYLAFIINDPNVERRVDLLV